MDLFRSFLFSFLNGDISPVNSHTYSLPIPPSTYPNSLPQTLPLSVHDLDAEGYGLAQKLQAFYEQSLLPRFLSQI